MPVLELSATLLCPCSTYKTPRVAWCTDKVNHQCVNVQNVCVHILPEQVCVSSASGWATTMFLITTSVKMIALRQLIKLFQFFMICLFFTWQKVFWNAYFPQPKMTAKSGQIT